MSLILLHCHCGLTYLAPRALEPCPDCGSCKTTVLTTRPTADELALYLTAEEIKDRDEIRRENRGLYS